MRTALLLAALLALAACSDAGVQQASVRQCLPQSLPDPANPTAGMVSIKAGAMLMGAKPLREEEGPPHRVEITAFLIDRTDVTNAEFAAFIAATGYITVAERGPNPSSLVFSPPEGDQPVGDIADWWRIVPGADWRHPYGPGSSLEGRDHLPVVHVAYEDALAYAHWLGRDLPTEAEWEYAARGGIDGAEYAWGNAPSGNKKPRANIWQGPFPYLDDGEDGFAMQPSPVGCFEANGFGLYDMAGNVWQWTRDLYVPGPFDEADSAPQTASFDPAAPDAAQRVIKGGSYLCADNFCMRYRPAARTGASAGDGASHIGFRTVFRPAPDDRRTAQTTGESRP